MFKIKWCLWAICLIKYQDYKWMNSSQNCQLSFFDLWTLTKDDLMQLTLSQSSIFALLVETKQAYFIFRIAFTGVVGVAVITLSDNFLLLFDLFILFIDHLEWSLSSLVVICSFDYFRLWSGAFKFHRFVAYYTFSFRYVGITLQSSIFIFIKCLFAWFLKISAFNHWIWLDLGQLRSGFSRILFEDLFVAMEIKFKVVENV